MLLHTLLRKFDPDLPLDALPNTEIHSVQEDSRRMAPGDLFVARPGVATDGARFIADAAARGAVAAVTAHAIENCPLPQVLAPRIESAASRLANILYGQPSQAIRVLAVTGTNGKTTTAYLVRHLLASVGRRCGMIGTVEIDDGRQRTEAAMTTPAAVDIAQLLAAMRDNGCAACAIETSSHALDQGRIAGVEFAAGAFTNLTGDHLDYHRTMENYASAKARLFEMLAPGAIAAVNAEDPWTPRLIRDCRARILRWGFTEAADYRATDIRVTAEGSTFRLRTPAGSAVVHMHLIGHHNIANALTAAVLVGEVFNLSADQIAAGLADAAGAPGRLQSVRCGQPFAILVDYAHTDDALENVLNALRPLTTGRLRVLFGCGGDRDRTKRPRMARTAEKLADDVYVTSDNPRTEDPQSIIDEILSGFSADLRSSGARLKVDADRRSAIRAILADARPGDVVLLAGKGHENYQIIGKEKRHFDDVEEARRALAEQHSAASSAAAGLDP